MTIGAVAGHLDCARLVAGVSGDVAALWGAWDLEQRRLRWWVAVPPASAASFGAPEEVPTGPADALDADAALDAAGTLTVRLDLGRATRGAVAHVA